MLSRLPHPFVLLAGGIVLGAILTHVVPAGEYARRTDPGSGRSFVEAGTYHAVPAAPASVLGMLRAVPRGFTDAADVIASVFLVGGAFVVIERTGALALALAALARRLGRRSHLAVAACCVLFAAGGAIENMQEEVVALVPTLVLLATRVGATPLTAVAMSAGAAAVGAAFSPINPFQAGIAQQAAGLQPFSGPWPRVAVLLPALAIWTWAVMRQVRGGAGPVAPGEPASGAITARTAVVLGLVLAGLAVFILGLTRWGWGFQELSAVFVAVGILAGLAGGLRAGGTAAAFADGFREMAYAAVLIGVARGIFVVLQEGHVIDTIVRALAEPLAGAPRAVGVLAMVGLQSVIHIPVPSVSGQAVLTLPILAPVADLLQISRQAAVLAYQTGAGLAELVTPTNGALMAVLAAAGVPYQSWLRFVLPLWLGLLALGSLAALALAFTGA